jgi:hypothetical protein
MKAAGALASLALALLPGAALAQETPPPEPAAPATQPAGGHMKVVPEAVHGRSPAVLVGERWRVRGIVKPYIAGQSATVGFYRGSKLLRQVTVAIQSGPDSRGQFVVGFSASRPGRVTVRAVHFATPQQVTLVANPKSVRVVRARVRPGARTLAARLLQQRLRALGYAVPRSGRYDGGTARAVMAFRKVAGMARTTQAGAEVMRRLRRGDGRFRVRFPKHGRHIEASLSKQVLALIDRGRVQRIYHISSGAPSTPTILGSFRFYLKTPGINAKGMVHSSYFIRGYAVHGYASVPVYPASHGCLRVPVPDAASIFRWIRLGDRIDVYR